MGKKRPVMSHDPMTGLDETGDDIRPDVASAPGVRKTSVASDINKSAHTDSAVVMLESTLTIAESTELHEILLGHVRSMKPLTINAAEVDIIDAAGLQLVAATFRTANEKGLSVQIDAPSACFVSAARQVGLDVLFGLNDGSCGV